MTDDQAPTSWMTLEKGTTVLSADGEELGSIAEVIADRQKDIFSGVTISTGLLSTNRFAPAAIIDEMSPTSVTLTVTAAEAADLEDYEG